jgi:hypothetical protein
MSTRCVRRLLRRAGEGLEGGASGGGMLDARGHPVGYWGVHREAPATRFALRGGRAGTVARTVAGQRGLAAEGSAEGIVALVHVSNTRSASRHVVGTVF